MANKMKKSEIKETENNNNDRTNRLIRSTMVLMAVMVFINMIAVVEGQCNASSFEGVDYDCCTIVSFPGVQSPPECAFACSHVGSATHFSCKFASQTAQSLDSPCTDGCQCKSAKGGIKSGAISGLVNSDCTASPTVMPTTLSPTMSPTVSPSASPTLSPVEAPRLLLVGPYVVKSNADGDVIWNVSIPSGYMVSQLAYDSKGHVFAVGSYQGQLAVAVKLNTTDGSVCWSKRLHVTSPTLTNRGSVSLAISTSVHVDDHDDVVVSGTSLWSPSASEAGANDNSERLSDTFMLKVAAEGNTLWLRTSGNISNDETVDLSDGELEWHGSCDTQLDPSCLRERWCCPIRVVGVLVFKPATALTQSPTVSPTAPTAAPTSSPSCVADVRSDLCQDVENCCHADQLTRGLVRQTCQTLCCTVMCDDEDSGSGL